MGYMYVVQYVCMSYRVARDCGVTILLLYSPVLRLEWGIVELARSSKSRISLMSNPFSPVGSVNGVVFVYSAHDRHDITRMLKTNDK
jgi:hypothetical protein